MSEGLDTLVRMVDQIVANLGHLDDDDVAGAVATHLRQFWTPAMRRELQDAVAAGEVDVDPVARAALALLAPVGR